MQETTRRRITFLRAEGDEKYCRMSNDAHLISNNYFKTCSGEYVLLHLHIPNKFGLPAGYFDQGIPDLIED